MIGFLYIITNKINGKQYVGKTYMELSKRIAIHTQDSKRYPNRPLYRAINKYGEENFIYVEVGRYEEGSLEKEEIWLINKLDTYKNGYNATLGGDGKRYFECPDQIVINLYHNLGQVKLVAEELNCSTDTISLVLKRNKINTSITIKTTLVEKQLQFNSLREAARYLIENDYTTNTDEGSVGTKIKYVLQGKKKTAYGFHWK